LLKSVAGIFSLFRNNDRLAGTFSWSEAVNFVFAKNRQMATQFSENRIFCCKFPIFEKKIRQKNPTGYGFQSFLK